MYKRTRRVLHIWNGVFFETISGSISIPRLQIIVEPVAFDTIDLV